MKSSEKGKAILVLEKSDDGYWVSVQNLPGCYSFGTTIEEAISNTRNAISEHISNIPDKEATPEIFRTAIYDLQIRYDLQTLFQRFKELNKSALAERAGINSSLLRQYSNGLAFASEKQKAKIEKAIHQIGTSLLEVRL